MVACVALAEYTSGLLQQISGAVDAVNLLSPCPAHSPAYHNSIICSPEVSCSSINHLEITPQTETHYKNGRVRDTVSTLSSGPKPYPNPACPSASPSGNNMRSALQFARLETSLDSRLSIYAMLFCFPRSDRGRVRTNSATTAAMAPNSMSLLNIDRPPLLTATWSAMVRGSSSISSETRSISHLQQRRPHSG